MPRESSLGDNYFKICTKKSGNCLEIANGDATSGAPVQLNTFRRRGSRVRSHGNLAGARDWRAAPSGPKGSGH
jgi:hypothetical protein